ncbi:MAG TPA: DUF4276 family protein [Longimicrobium sp.]|nr:DUF4276 family protein [Longimicrobium sp.]
MSEIRIYVEGGGDKDSKARMRQAFSQFFSEPRARAHQKRKPLRVIPCGSRDDTFKAFRAAVRDHAEDQVFLLVDAEQPVSGTPREHLAARDPWDLSFASDDQCHLMAQVMESWFLADPDALAGFYGPQFGIKQIPPRKNVEEVPKSEVEAVLKGSTTKTSKGEYHKIRHGAPILESLNADRVRSRAPHCNRLFEALQEAIG